MVDVHLKRAGASYIFTLRAASGLHKKWIQDHLLSDLRLHLRRRVGEACRVQLEVAEAPPKLPVKPGRSLFPPAFSPAPENPSPRKGIFNPEYTFENFVVGRHNEFAHGACLSVSRAALKKTGAAGNFNPLFIYGPSGLGKTHLLNAVGQEILRSRPEARVFYLSAERFLNECIQALQKREMPEFQKKYRRGCGILLMDDIQMVSKGPRVQEEFFHTFNELHSRNVPVVVCCDKPPARIPKLEERIRSRLQGGLVVDISCPDRETRLAILRRKAERKGLSLSGESCGQIADAFKTSVREIEGALNKIKMKTDLRGGKLSQLEIQEILKESAKPALTAEIIQNKVAEKFHISLEDLRSPSRKKNVVAARQTAMLFIKTLLGKSLSETGHIFGKKDHTTVLNAIRKIRRLKENNAEFRIFFEDLQRNFEARR